VFGDWREHGRPFDVIPYPHARPSRHKRERAEIAFRPLVFLWDAAPDAKDGNGALDTLFKSVGNGLAHIERTHRDGRRGCCLVAGSTKEALKAGSAVVEAARVAKRSLRIICDFGLVLGGDLKPDKKLIARLQSADDLPGLPIDCVLATEAYAAQAKFDLGEEVLLVPVGRAEALVANDDAERQAIRSRPSLPIYMVDWAHHRS
jgi:hypothetical protein